MSPRGITASLTLLAILMMAGVAHIASLLALPFVAPDDAYARVFAAAPEGRVTPLPRAGTPGDPLPGRDPSAATAVCRYDLGQGPLRVSAAATGGDLVALTFHARSGLSFYGLTDRAAEDGKLDVVVMTRAQLEAAQARDAPDAPVRDVRVVAPQALGFVSLDVLARVGGYARAERGLASMGCRTERPV